MTNRISGTGMWGLHPLIPFGHHPKNSEPAVVARDKVPRWTSSKTYGSLVKTMLGQNEWRYKKTGILIEKQGIAGIALVQSETSPKALAKYKDTIKAIRKIFVVMEVKNSIHGVCGPVIPEHPSQDPAASSSPNKSTFLLRRLLYRDFSADPIDGKPESLSPIWRVMIWYDRHTLHFHPPLFARVSHKLILPCKIKVLTQKWLWIPWCTIMYY